MARKLKLCDRAGFPGITCSISMLRRSRRVAAALEVNAIVSAKFSDSWFPGRVIGTSSERGYVRVGWDDGSYSDVRVTNVVLVQPPGEDEVSSDDDSDDVDGDDESDVDDVDDGDGDNDVDDNDEDNGDDNESHTGKNRRCRTNRSIHPRRRKRPYRSRSAASRLLVEAMSPRSALRPVVLEGLRDAYEGDDQVTDEDYFDSVVESQEREGHVALVHDKARNRFYGRALAHLMGVLFRRPRNASGLLLCDVGCGPSLLLTRIAVREFERAAPNLTWRRNARFCAFDIGKRTFSAAHRYLVDHPLGAGVEVMHADADKGKGRARVATCDVLLHEVFGMLASSEGFTQWVRRARRATVVPDTAATLFQLVDYADAVKAFPRGLHVGDRVALANVAFTHCTSTSADVGVLELFAGGSTRGGATNWGKDQRHVSMFRIRTSGDVAALGCFIFLGHGDEKKKPTSRKRKNSGSTSSSSSSCCCCCSVTTRRTSRSNVYTKPLACAQAELARDSVASRGSSSNSKTSLLPRRRDWTTSDARDGLLSSRNWKNVLLLLPCVLQVEVGDLVTVVTTVTGLMNKKLTYGADVTLHRARCQIGDTITIEVTQRDLFPWWETKEKKTVSAASRASPMAKGKRDDSAVIRSCRM